MVNPSWLVYVNHKLVSFRFGQGDGDGSIGGEAYVKTCVATVYLAFVDRNVASISFYLDVSMRTTGRGWIDNQTAYGGFLLGDEMNSSLFAYFL